LSEIEALPVDWLWQGYIPAGMLTILDGDPGIGKSTLTDDLAARASSGRTMPDGSPGHPPAGVVLLSAEDDPARTIRPRLEAAGADLDRIVLLSLPAGGGDLRPPMITKTDLAKVELALTDESVSLLVLDPLVAYMPDGTDTNRDHNVRPVLALLKSLAERAGCAVIGVRHLRKSGGDNPLYRGGGSIAFTGIVRAELLLAHDPQDPTRERRVLAATKASLGPMPPSLAFHLVTEPGRNHPRVAWDGVSAHDAWSLSAVPAIEGSTSAIDEAVGVLREILASGPQPASMAKRQAATAGVAGRTLDRAKAKLGIKVSHVGKPGEANQSWEWSLPTKDASHTPRTPSPELGNLGPSLAHFEDADCGVTP
jgi:hypothetical protein